MNNENHLPREVLEAEVECLRKHLKIALEEVDKLKKIIDGYKSITFGNNNEGENHDWSVPC